MCVLVSRSGLKNCPRALQLLEQLKWAPEDARLSDKLISQAAALHTIMPAGHRMGQPQVSIFTGHMLLKYVVRALKHRGHPNSG